MNEEYTPETVCEGRSTFKLTQQQIIKSLLNEDHIRVQNMLCKPSKFIKIMDNGKYSILYKTSLKHIVKQNIVNWQLNRPVDNVRVPEIAKDIYDLQQVFGIIYIVYNEESSQFECYDGIHRYEAMKYLYSLKECKKHVKDINVLVDISSQYDEKYIIDKFTTINKCVPIPELFVKKESNTNMRTKIVEITENFIKKYPKMFKSSSKPNVPHENRDRFMDKIMDIIIECDLENVPSDIIIELLLQYNTFMKEHLNETNTIHNRKLTVTQKIKCDDNNMFIFWNKNWEIHFKKCFHNKEIFMNK